MCVSDVKVSEWWSCAHRAARERVVHSCAEALFSLPSLPLPFPPCLSLFSRQISRFAFMPMVDSKYNNSQTCLLCFISLLSQLAHREGKAEMNMLCRFFVHCLQNAPTTQRNASEARRHPLLTFSTLCLLSWRTRLSRRCEVRLVDKSLRSASPGHRHLSKSLRSARAIARAWEWTTEIPTILN